MKKVTNNETIKTGKDCLQIWLLIIYLNNLSFIYEIRVKICDKIKI